MTQDDSLLLHADPRDNRPSMADLLAPIPLPDPVDEIRYERGEETETMILRSGRWFVKWPYTITDCYVVRYIKRSLFGSAKAVLVLDDRKLEEKRREMFGYAYEELLRHVDTD